MLGYFQGTGAVATAVDKDVMNSLIELSLIEEYKWTPHYIRSLSYKWIQKHLLIKRARGMAQDHQAQLAKHKSQSRPLKPGQKKMMEV